MADCELAKKLWSLGLSIIVYLNNQFFNKVIKKGITLIQKLTNIVSNLSYLRIWEYIAYLRLPEETLVKSEKFYLISRKHSFISYNSYL